jgi:hypothetical protein
VLDAITMERRGLPAACVGVEKLVDTTGRGMCRAQGLPSFPIAKIDYHAGSLASLKDDAQLGAWGIRIADQIEQILTRGEISIDA